jgi:hypothetical protein
MSYTPRTYSEIFLDMMLDAFGKGLLGSDNNFIGYVTAKNEDIENTVILELSIHALKLAEFYDQLTIVRNEQNIQLANLDGLRVIGQMYFPMIPADYAITDITF